MSIASILRSTWLLASAAALALVACSEVPEAPTANNPFDPAGDAAGSGYKLSAVVAGDSVSLSWVDLDVVSWVVRHSATSNVFSEMDDISVTSLVTRAGGVASLVHRGLARESVNYYAVRGQGMVAGTPIAVDVPVLFIAAGGRRNVPTRTVEVEVRTGVADQMELADNADFDAAVPFDVTPGVRATLPWTLGTASAAGDTLRVYGRARTASSVGPARVVRFTANFNPALSPVSGQRVTPTGLVTVDTLVVLQATGEGIVDLVVRQIVDEVEIETEIDDPSEPFALAVPTTATSAVVYTADFGGDFGYRVSRTITLTPALQITGASLSVEGGAQTTTERDIRLLVTAIGAAEMIVSEDAGFADATWTAIADTLEFELSEGFGQKTIFAAFRNPFVPDRPTASTGITYLVPPARTPSPGSRDADSHPIRRDR